MANSGGEMSGGDPEVVAEALEEWSPIREQTVSVARTPVQAVYSSLVDEDGGSSDMDTEEDMTPLISRNRVVREFEVFATANASDNGNFAPVAAEPVSKRKRVTDFVPVADELTRCKRMLEQPLENPASSIGQTSPSSMSVWFDRPSKLRKIGDTRDIQEVSTGESQVEVPLYDRACVSILSSPCATDSPDGYISVEPEEAARCFNCGSYSHSLSNCSRSRDIMAIKNARKTLLDRRGSLSRSRTASRYYEGSPGGKFDDLKPGVLGLEARKVLGIGELDPPPWLNRMRELGYPPGYFEDQEDESSGVKIFDEIAESVTGEEVTEDGEIVENISPVVCEISAGKRMAVDYPGINAPIPDNADKKLWAPLPEIQSEKLSGSRILSPSLSPNSLVVGKGDRLSRYVSSLRDISVGLGGGHCRNGFDGMKSHGGGSSILGSPGDSQTGNPSISHNNHLPKGQSTGPSSLMFGWQDYTSPKSGVQEFQQTSLRLSGLASLTFGMATPKLGSAESLFSSPSQIYPSNNHSDPKTQISSLPAPHRANEAWLKAQVALAALQSSQNFRGLLPPPQAISWKSRGSGLPPQHSRSEL